MTCSCRAQLVRIDAESGLLRWDQAVGRDTFENEVRISACDFCALELSRCSCALPLQEQPPGDLLGHYCLVGGCNVCNNLTAKLRALLCTVITGRSPRLPSRAHTGGGKQSGVLGLAVVGHDEYGVEVTWLLGFTDAVFATFSSLITCCVSSVYLVRCLRPHCRLCACHDPSTNLCLQVLAHAKYVLGYVVLGPVALLLLAEAVRVSATLPGGHEIKTVTQSRWHRINLQVGLMIWEYTSSLYRSSAVFVPRHTSSDAHSTVTKQGLKLPSAQLLQRTQQCAGVS